MTLQRAGAVVQLCNMLTLEELSNPREYEEICGDIEEELEVYIERAGRRASARVAGATSRR
jgi:hypothetical protein